MYTVFCCANFSRSNINYVRDKMTFLNGLKIKIQNNIKHWKISVFLVGIIPLFPEYISPFLVSTAMFFAILHSREKGKKIKIGTLGRILLGYMAYMSLGIFSSSDKSSVLYTIIIWGTMFAAYIAVYTVCSGRRKLDFLILVMTLSAGLSGAVGFIQYLLYSVFGSSTKGIWNFADTRILGAFSSDIYLSGFTGRVESTFNNPNIFAHYLIMALPFAVYYSFAGKKSRYYGICNISIITIISGIAFTLSRGSFIALIAVIIFYSMTRIRNIARILIASAAGIVISFAPVIERFMFLSSGNPMNDIRLDIWISGIRYIRQSPLTGHGAGIINTWNYLSETGIDTPHMHNIFLQISAESGIIGIIIFAGIMWQMARTAGCLLLEENYAHVLGITLIAFITGFAVTGITDYPLMTPKLIGMMFTVIAIADCSSRLYLFREPVSRLSLLFSSRVLEIMGERGFIYYTDSYVRKNKDIS